MDQHPIPQNVTGFQFKLIGAMTVKQFGYVASGVIAAVVIYYLPINGFFANLLKIILIPLFGASGAIMAFVPIDGRPVDVMAGNFLKALLSPNQYIYRKDTLAFSFSKIQLAKPNPKTQTAHDMKTPKQNIINQKGLELQKILNKSSQNKIRNAQDEKETVFLNSILKSSDVSSPAQVSPPTTPASSKQPVSVPINQPVKLADKPTPSPQEVKPTPEILSQKEEVLKKQLEFTKREEASPHSPKDQADIHQKTLALEEQVRLVHAQKQQLEEEIVKLKQQLAAQQKISAPSIPAQTKPAPLPPPQAPAHVRSVPKDMNKKLGIFVSDTPNVVSGMVKDSRGNVLPNILVEIKDKAGNPVRAFKTNSLGNFASATPLAAGIYTITLEDVRKLHTFDSIQITANDQIMLPIEITSYDKREELRKELFTNN